MPELPEAETVARTISPHIVDCRFVSYELLRKQTLNEAGYPLSFILDKRISKVHRRGKLIILDLEQNSKGNSNSGMLLFHLRMTGRLFTSTANSRQGKHTRCIFTLEKSDGTPVKLFFDDMRAFGQIMACDQEKLSQWPFWRDLGPEPLEVSLSDFIPRLKGGRPVKTGLLDQKLLAGIGNIYADESLFHAGIKPERSLDSLSEEEAGHLLAAIQKVLKESIAQCGSSIRDYRDANGNTGAFQNSFYVYGRGGKECRLCGSTLIKSRLGGRATVYCPVCQK